MLFGKSEFNASSFIHSVMIVLFLLLLVYGTTNLDEFSSI